MLITRKSSFRFAAVAAIAVSSTFAVAAQATDITGAGSSFVYPVMSKWSAAYAEKTGNHLNYQSVGSGAGIAQIKEGTIDFGASDAPMKAEDLQQLGLGQFPIVVGGIVPVVNIAGVKAGQIKLAGFDAPESIVNQLKDGTFELTIAQHPAEIGYFGFMAAYANATGNPVPTQIGTGFTVMTKDNIDDPKVARYLYKSS